VRKYTDDQEIARVKSNLNQCKKLFSFLGSTWIEEELFQLKERPKAHPLFWMLLDEVKSNKLQSWLEALSSTLPETKFSGLLNKLRKSCEGIDFYSLLSEIEVVSFYARTQEIEYEPPCGDIRLSVNGYEVFVEIARLFSSHEEERIHSLSQLVWSRLEDLSENKYVLSFSISPEFSESDIDPFVRFASETIIQKLTSLPSKLSFEGKKAALTILCPSKKDKGYVAGNLIGVMLLDTAGRLKKKLLDEVEQLPKDKLNVIVYNITHVGTDFDDVEDAFLGQTALRVYVDKRTHATWTEPIRKENGAIHGKNGEQISAAIAYKDFNYENRRIYLNPVAKTTFTDEVKAKL
jgi:hypothetical protein